MIFGPRGSQNRFVNLSIHINQHVIYRISNNSNPNYAKFLGICMDENLTWQPHFNHLKRRLSYSLFQMSRLKFVLPPRILRLLYFSTFQCHLEYGLGIWGCIPSIRNKIFLLQKKAIRLINRAPYRAHTLPLFSKSSILNIHDLFSAHVAGFMFDYVHGNLPMTFIDYFPTRHHLAYHTRQAALMPLPFSRTVFAATLPLHTYPGIWNQYKYLANRCITKAQFLRKIKAHFMAHYLQ